MGTAPDVAYPNGRCLACGHGLNDDRECVNADCTEYQRSYELVTDGPPLTLTVRGGNVYITDKQAPHPSWMAEADLDAFLALADKIKEDAQR